MPIPPPSTQRRCPICNTQTAAQHCPSDGTQTLRQGAATRDALSYRPGEVLGGRYKVLGTLGRGGFGAVYAGEHTGTKQLVALKVLALDASTADDDVVKRFFQEAQVTARLKAQNTVRLFDVGQDDGGPLFLAMELLEGPNLQLVLKALKSEGRVMTEPQTLDIAIAVLRSLHEAHGHGLVHRDLKPANVILATSEDDEPLVKVLDFGIARTQDSSLTGSGRALGTPSYMSPEQCECEPLDGRSDLYSLGVILFECVCGVLPYVNDSAMGVMYMHRHGEIPSLRAAAQTPVSTGFVQVVQRLLAKSPSARAKDARSLRAELEALRSQSHVAGTPPPLPSTANTISAPQRTQPYARGSTSDDPPSTIQVPVTPHRAGAALSKPSASTSAAPASGRLAPLTLLTGKLPTGERPVAVADLMAQAVQDADEAPPDEGEVQPEVAEVDDSAPRQHRLLRSAVAASLGLLAAAAAIWALRQSDQPSIAPSGQQVPASPAVPPPLPAPPPLQAAPATAASPPIKALGGAPMAPPAPPPVATPAVDADAITAKALADLATDAKNEVALRVKSAQEAARLQPANAEYKSLLDKVIAEQKAKSKQQSKPRKGSHEPKRGDID